jgi:hypothetical protein
MDHQQLIMLRQRIRASCHTARDERGAVLVITALAMVAMMGMAAYAMDVSIWFVHHRHLQTQADAAALGGSQAFQYPCTSGVGTVGTTDSNIAQIVHQYDGTTAPTPTQPNNPQVAVVPALGAPNPPLSAFTPPQQTLFSVLNRPDFFPAQSKPNDTDLSGTDGSDGSPCTDGKIDVKVTETNLPSHIVPFGPDFVNAQARVTIENLASINSGLLPLAEPLPVPNSMAAYLIDEGNGNAVLATIQLKATNTDKTAWAANGVAVNLAQNGPMKGPIGMQIAESPGSGTAPAPCDNLNGDQCFDTTDNIGITYSRVWPGTGSANFPSNPPQIGDTSVVPAPTSVAPPPTGGCPNVPGIPFSNFISSSTSCGVKLNVDMQFGATATCASVGNFRVTAGSATASLSNPNCAVGTNSPNGTWTSALINVGPSAGPVPLDLKWSQTSGATPSWASGGNNAGQCGNGSNACTKDFGVVQRIFSGAFDSQSATSSHSGGVLAASLADGSSGNELQTIRTNALPTSVNVAVNVLSFQNAQSIPSAPLELSFGGNQANASVSCPGLSAGQPFLAQSLVTGCVPPNNNFALNSNFTATPCNPTTNSAGVAICLPEDPGNGKLDAVLDDSMNTRINGSKNAPCTGFNYWAKPNTIDKVLLQKSPPDPRLVTIVVTDYAALANGRTQVPIRNIANFYVTGWQGDPCIHQTNGVNISSGLSYTGDDDPTAANPPTCDVKNNNGPLQNCSGVLLGHFVQYTVPSTSGTGSGQCVQTTSLGSCIAVLTK